MNGSMRSGLTFSVVLHVALLVLAVFGMPFFRTPLPDADDLIVVEMVELADKTEAPPPKAKPDPKPEPEALPEPEPEPEPEALPEPEPQPEPVPEPEPKTQPDPAPEEVADAPPEEIIPPQNRPPAPPKKPKKLPKPDPFDNLASLVKNLENQVKDRPAPTADTAPEKSPVRNAPPTLSEKALVDAKAAIKGHIERHWIINSGIKGIEEMTVDVRVVLNPDGSVQRVAAQDLGRMMIDPAFRAFAESAEAAVKRAQPIPIPPQMYEELRDLIFTFTPKGQIR